MSKFKKMTLVLIALTLLLNHGAGFTQGGISLSPEEKLKKSNEYYTSGKQLLAEGNYAQADAEFKKAQMLLSASPAVIIPNPKPQNQPLAEVKKKEIKKAVILPPSIAKLAWQFSQQDKPGEAIPLYLKAIKQNPANVNLYYNLGIDYLKTNQFQKAQECFIKCIQLSPKDADSYYNLAVLNESYLKNKELSLRYYNLYLKYTAEKDKANEVRSWMARIKKELNQWMTNNYKIYSLT